MDLNPLDWSLWLSIPVGIFVYACIAIGDAALWRWWAESVPATTWDYASQSYVRKGEEKKKYEFRNDIGVPWAAGWPLKYVWMSIAAAVLGAITQIERFLDTISASGEKTAQAKVMEQRLRRYDELWEKISKWELPRDFDGKYRQNDLTRQQLDNWLEFKELEKFVPARPLPPQIKHTEEITYKAEKDARDVAHYGGY